MQQVILNVEESKYAALLQVLQSLDYVKIVQAPAAPVKNGRKPTYDFSDLAGKLEWQGDVVAEQRKLRDEW